MTVMKDYLKIGLIQPVIDCDLCWNFEKPYKLNIDLISSERVWQEILDGIRSFIKSDNKPDIILIPELHLPVHRKSEIKEFSKKHNIMFARGKIIISRFKSPLPCFYFRSEAGWDVRGDVKSSYVTPPPF